MKTENIRTVVDTIGFAHLNWQMDAVTKRINKQFSDELAEVSQAENTVWKAAICPHDDYTYTSWLYPAVLKNVKAKTVILFGVAHKAKNFGLENQLVFDSFTQWNGPFGPVKVSPLREKIMKHLPKDFYVVHDSMQTVEHSVEALIPFLQDQNKDVEIVSILIPYTSLSKMDSISSALANALFTVSKEEQLSWGNDFALVITTDAVHYGDKDWGGKNYARFGTDSVGFKNAIAFEHQIINDCFEGDLSTEKAEKFYDYTVQESDFREYKWTWCGRYSVPMGLETAAKLQTLNGINPLQGIPLGYQNSIDHTELQVEDLGMGKTAGASLNHWVGYASVGFK